MLTETFGHTRMLKWSVVGAAHWFVMVAFIVLSSLVLEAYFEVVDPDGGAADHRPLGGRTAWSPRSSACSGLLGILALIVDPAAQPAGQRRAGCPASPARRCGRATSSSAIIVAVLVCGFLIRGFKVANDHFEFPVWATPVSHALGDGAAGQRAPRSRVVALVKIVISMTWLIVIALNVTMGVAWHRFLAFPNIFFKRDAARRPARARRAAADDVAAASRSTSRRPTRRRTSSASPRSSSSPGRACSTSPPAPSAAAASRSARPGTPASRCRRSCSCCQPARPRVRQGAVPAGRRRQGPDRRGEGTRSSSPRDALALAEAERPLIGDAPRTAASSTRTCCGPAPPAAPASSSARSTSSTSTTSSTCAATRC